LTHPILFYLVKTIQPRRVDEGNVIPTSYYRLAGFSTEKAKPSPFTEKALSFPVSPGSKPLM